MDPVEHALTRLREPAYAHAEHLVVVRDGALTAAHALGERPLDSSAEVFSVTKSVLSTMVMLLIRDGAVDLDATLGELLGARVPAQRRPARVRDLLAMTSGAHCDGLEAIDRVMELPAGWVDALLAEPQRHRPGTVFRYDNGAAHLLAAATQAVAGDLVEAAADRVFKPLGITGWHWPRDPDGIPWGFGGLQLSAFDLARLGEAWCTDALGLGGLLTTATTAHTDGGPPERLPYGWLFWIERVAGRPAFLAAGWAGQYVLVVPSARLTLVVTGIPARMHAGTGIPIDVLRTLATDLTNS